MAILITKRPEKYIGSRFGRWTALHNPINFELSRKDYNVINTALRTYIHPTLPSVKTDALPAELPLFAIPGDRIYLSSGNYTGVQTIHSVVDEYIVIDTAVNGVGGSGWVNLVDFLTDFKIGLRLKQIDTNEVIDTGFFTPDNTGLSIIDVSGMLKKLLITESTFTTMTANRKNDKISGGYYIEYSINCTLPSAVHVSGTWVGDATEYFWISAARQVPEFYGQNMIEYTPLNQANYYAKFLTKFEQPTMWEGYEFSMSFIYSEEFEETYITRHQQNKNINGVATSGESNVTLANSEAKFMNEMLIADVDATTTKAEVWLETGGAIPSGGGYVEDDYMSSGFVSAHAESLPT